VDEYLHPDPRPGPAEVEAFPSVAAFPAAEADQAAEELPPMAADPAEGLTRAAYIEIGLESAGETVDIGDVHSAAEPSPGGRPGPANSGHPDLLSSAAHLTIRLIPAQWRK